MPQENSFFDLVLPIFTNDSGVCGVGGDSYRLVMSPELERGEEVAQMGKGCWSDKA